MRKLLSRRNILGLIILITALLFGTYLEARPRLASDQAPLADISNIEIPRTQFNQDFGKTRLIILVSPT